MLPSETIELAIYKFVESVRPLPANVTIQQLSNIIGESDHVRIVERLTDLDANGRLLLSKYLAGQKLPFARFEPNAFFYSDSFMMEIAPGGRKHFEELERKATQDVASNERPRYFDSPGAGAKSRVILAFDPIQNSVESIPPHLPDERKWQRRFQQGEPESHQLWLRGVRT